MGNCNVFNFIIMHRPLIEWTSNTVSIHINYLPLVAWVSLTWFSIMSWSWKLWALFASSIKGEIVIPPTWFLDTFDLIFIRSWPVWTWSAISPVHCVHLWCFALSLWSNKALISPICSNVSPGLLNFTLWENCLSSLLNLHFNVHHFSCTTRNLCSFHVLRKLLKYLICSY